MRDEDAPFRYRSLNAHAELRQCFLRRRIALPPCNGLDVCPLRLRDTSDIHDRERERYVEPACQLLDETGVGFRIGTPQRVVDMQHCKRPDFLPFVQGVHQVCERRRIGSARNHEEHRLQRIGHPPRHDALEDLFLKRAHSVFQICHAAIVPRLSKSHQLVCLLL